LTKRRRGEKPVFWRVRSHPPNPKKKKYSQQEKKASNTGWQEILG